MKRSGIRTTIVFAALIEAAVRTQTPQPFPKPETRQPAQPPVARPAPPPDPTVLPPQTSTPSAGEPSETTLGTSIYPGAQFITSYDAGRGQRYYLYGTSAGFAEIVAYYRTLLKQRGELTFDAPPIHLFEVGRFREDTMAFPPSVTIKDYTWGGSDGYINPRPGTPRHFRTIIQIVPVPAVPGAKR